jgi:hypothetical protein
MKTKCEHIELSTDDPARARDFYSKLFGWKIDGTPMPGGGGEYLMFRTDNGGGGITAKMMPQQPTAWLPYITVDSVQRTLDAATSMGASTVVPHTPVGDMGAIAVLMDPTGAAVGIWESAKPAAPAKAPAKTAKPAKAPAKAAKPAKPAAKPAKAAAKGKKPAKKGKR